MKRTFYTLILFAVLLQSCSLNVPDNSTYYAIGIAGKSGSTSFITSDDLKTAMLKNITIPDSVIDLRVYADGKRTKDISGFDAVLEADRCLIVVMKKAKTIDNQNIIDKENNAGVILDYTSVVQTGKYLNIFLEYYAANTKKHSFDFLINGEKEHFENDKVTINICHNDGGDEKKDKYFSPFSLDLTNLFEKFKNDFDIVFVYNTETKEKKEVLIKIKRF